jgi:hypothetical protein
MFLTDWLWSQYQVFVDERVFGGFAPLPPNGTVIVTKPHAGSRYPGHPDWEGMQTVQRAAIKMDDISWVDNPNGVAELDFRLLGDFLRGGKQGDLHTGRPLGLPRPELGCIGLDFV